MLKFEGEVDKYHEGLAYLRNVTVTMDCSTPNATIFYTTDGLSSPTKDSPMRAAPGDQIMWVEEGTTTFTAAAFAFAMFESDVSTWAVTVVAPRLDEHDLAETGAGGKTLFEMGRGRQVKVDSHNLFGYRCLVQNVGKGDKEEKDSV